MWDMPRYRELESETNANLDTNFPVVYKHENSNAAVTCLTPSVVQDVFHLAEAVEEIRAIPILFRYVEVSRPARTTKIVVPTPTTRFQSFQRNL